MERIHFPMQVMNITTRMNEGTHASSYAIDLAGRDKGSDAVLAPFTGVVRKKYPKGNTVWLESVAPVQFADGRVDYATLMLTHDNDISDLSVGQVIGQGQEFYQEGTAGVATGNHVHVGIGAGRFTGSGWFQNRLGYWVVNNEVKPFDAFLLDGTTVLNGGGYEWKLNEGGTMQIPDTDNYYSRYGKDLTLRLRGYEFSRDDFRRYIVGKTDLEAVEFISSGPDADTAQLWQDVGKNAVTDDWVGQIKNLTKQVKEAHQGTAEGEAERKLQLIRDALGIK